MKAQAFLSKSKKAKSRGRLRPLPSELSKIWLRSQITIVIAKLLGTAGANPHVPGLSASHVVRAFSPPPAFSCLKLSSCLKRVSLPIPQLASVPLSSWKISLPLI